jgi:hypothetical protein
MEIVIQIPIGTEGREKVLVQCIWTTAKWSPLEHPRISRVILRK